MRQFQNNLRELKFPKLDSAFATELQCCTKCSQRRHSRTLKTLNVIIKRLPWIFLQGTATYPDCLTQEMTWGSNQLINR